MKMRRCAVAIAILWAAPFTGFADSAEVRATLELVWEFYWTQSGSPQYVSKWQQPIRVRVSGASVDYYRAFALEQLRRVADIAGITVVDVSDPTAPANLDVEIVRHVRLGTQDPCRTTRTPATGAIQRVKITAGERSARKCLLHESMHALGLSGHPRAASILSYFRESNELTKTDEFVLKVLYSDEVKPGMYPLVLLQIFARRLAEDAPAGAARLEAQAAAAQFLDESVEQMEAFARASGDPPRIVLRSARATSAGLERGRIEAQFHLGMAYSFGHAVAVDKTRGVEWFARAASSSHRDAQLHLADAYRSGSGIEADMVEAYKWYLLAAQKNSPRAKTEAQKLERTLSPGQLAQGKARAAAWRPAHKEAPAVQADR